MVFRRLTEGVAIPWAEQRCSNPEAWRGIVQRRDPGAAPLKVRPRFQAIPQGGNGQPIDGKPLGPARFVTSTPRVLSLVCIVAIRPVRSSLAMPTSIR